MKYLLLLYGDPEGEAALPPEELQRIVLGHRSLGAELRGTGVLVEAEALGPPLATVRMSDGNATVTDGPYAESKEQLGGFYVFECDCAGEALELAKQVPGFDRGVVVVVQPEHVEAAA